MSERFEIDGSALGTLVSWAGGMVISNKFLHGVFDDHWEMQEAGTILLPDFIRLSAEGKAKMKDGRVYLKREG